jgi:malate synthase
MPAGVVVKGSMKSGFANILTPDALNFVAKLHREFSNGREMILKKRIEKQSEIDNGHLPHFLP